MRLPCFENFPVLTTPRLRLRQITLDDADAIFTTFGDPEVMEFYGDLPHESVEETRALIRRQQAWYEQHEGIRWGITFRDQDEVIGSCGLFRFVNEDQRATLGYELNRAWWRKGIMSETLTSVLTYAFQTLELHRIEAVVDDVNERSKGLLRSLGFTHEGSLRQRFWFRERFLDEHYFGLLVDEWHPTLPAQP